LEIDAPKENVMNTHRNIETGVFYNFGFASNEKEWDFILKSERNKGAKCTICGSPLSRYNFTGICTACRNEKRRNIAGFKDYFQRKNEHRVMMQRSKNGSNIKSN
jgi:hypothetical protein